MRYAFNAQTIEITDGPPPPVPLNWYKVVISREEVKETNGDAGKGNQLAFYCKVIEGDYTGREQRKGMNLDNPNAQTVRIAQEELAKFSWVVGRPNFQDTQELFNIPLMALMGPQEGSTKYGDVFEVRDLNGKTPAELAKMGIQPAQNFATGMTAQPQAPAWGAQPQAAPTPAWGGPPAPASPTPFPTQGTPFASPAASIAPSPFPPQGIGPSTLPAFAIPASGAPGAAPATMSPSNWQQPGAPAAVPAWARK